MEFDFQLARLRKAFGKDMDEERKLIVWHAVEHIPARDFERFVTQLISTERSYPTPAQFREWSMSFRKADTAEEIRKQLSEAKVRCHNCIGSGIVDGRRAGEGFSGRYILRCTCTAGDLAGRLPEYRTLKRYNEVSDFVLASTVNEAIDNTAILQELRETPPEQRFEKAMSILRRGKP